MNEREINKTIANNLLYFMEKKGITQLELAEYMHVSQATISNWCKGIKLPRMDKIDRICEYFNINRSDLMEEHLFLYAHSYEKFTQSPYCRQLLKDFLSLNEVGQQKVIDYIADLADNNKYIGSTWLDGQLSFSGDDYTRLEMLEEEFLKKYPDDKNGEVG